LPDLSEKMGRGPGELEQFVAPPREKLPEKSFPTRYQPTAAPAAFVRTVSRLDAIYEHLWRDASALERLGMRTAYCG